MFHALHELEPVDPNRQAIRRMLIYEYMPYARHLASRYDSGDVPAEDLHQVAYVGLVKAVDDYDPDYGVPFLGYAAPKILGELKRHFRDATWPVHIPRRIKELSADVRPATETLRQRLKRDPTTAELAGLLGEDQSDVIEAIGASRLRTLVSLDVPADAGGESDLALGDLIGAEDPGLLNVVDRETLRPLLVGLSVRERKILLMTFFQQMTQSQIGAELGISQMHISRLLASTIGSLRRRAGCGEFG
jgi:RNA polymerase sigma-B factor